MFWKMLDGIARELSGHRAFECDRHIYETDRWSNFSDYHATAEWIAERLSDYGLESVELVECPADGKTRYSDWTMPLAWDAGEATLEIVAPEKLAGTRIARRSDEPSALAMWSAPTAPEGVTGEVVLLEKGTADEVSSLGRLDGKILLTHLQGRLIKKAAADAGAAGIVSDFTRNPDLMDSRGWENGWSDTPGGWMMTAGESEIWGFSITRRTGRQLRQIIRTGGAIKLHAKVDAKLHEGTLPYVTALVPGETDEEVLTLGHLYEHGANDNASGTATIMEACRTLDAMQKRGELKLKRSVRLLLMAECYGSLAFAKKNPDVMKRTVASLCLDGGAGLHGLVGSLMRVITGPNCHRSYADTAAVVAAREYYSKYRPDRPWQLLEYMQGTDNFFCDPAVGVPSIWYRGGHGGDYWHNTEDSLDKLDPESFLDWGCITAAFLGLMATAGEAEALWLLTEAVPLAGARIARLAEPMKRRIFDAGAGEADRIAALSELGRVTANIPDAEIRGFETYNRLAPESSLLGPAIEEASGAALAEADRLHVSVENASGLDAADRGPEPVSLGDGGDLVPVRNSEYITCLTLDGVPFDEWTAVGLDHSPRWWGPETCALWWCDGKMTLDEIASDVQFEIGHLPADMVGYFRMLERHGYVELRGGAERGAGNEEGSGK